MNRQWIYNIIAVISTLGILAWMVTGYFGGMIFFLLEYAQIIVSIIILYILSFIETLTSFALKGIKQNKIKIFFHGLVILTIILTIIFQSELLKSRRIFTAMQKDDQYYSTLVFRENGTCEYEVFGVFFIHEVLHGEYKFQADSIIFTKNPCDNNSIPDTLLIDRKQKAIFMYKDKQGKFDTEKEWLNHFEIL